MESVSMKTIARNLLVICLYWATYGVFCMRKLFMFVPQEWELLGAAVVCGFHMIAVVCFAWANCRLVGSAPLPVRAMVTSLLAISLTGVNAGLLYVVCGYLHMRGT